MNNILDCIHILIGALGVCLIDSTGIWFAVSLAMIIIAFAYATLRLVEYRGHLQ